MEELLSSKNKHVNLQCRGCLTIAPEMHDLFVGIVGVNGVNLKLIDILENTTSIKVSDDENLSRNLCSKCATIVIDFYNFRLRIQENEQYNKSLLEQINKKKEKPVSEDFNFPSPLIDFKDIKDDDSLSEETNYVYSDELSYRVEIVSEDIPNDEVHENVKYECSVCLLSYSRKDWLTQHMIDHHSRNGKDFSNAVTVCEDIKVVIESCGSRNVVPEEKNNTKNTNSGEEKESAQYTCNICSTSFTVKGCLKKHIYEEHLVNVEDLNKHSNKDMSLEIVESEGTEENKTQKLIKVKRYNCEICSTSYKQSTYFKRHMLFKHNLKRTDHSKYSSISFVTEEDKDSRVLTKVEKYSCSMCLTYYNKEFVFRKHMREKHCITVIDLSQYLKVVNVAIRRKSDFSCGSCISTFKTLKELNAHKSKHKPFICEHCGAGFPRKSNLIDHLQIHSKTLRYACSHCGKAFKTRTSHARHMSLHTKPGHFVCDICGRRFNQKGVMKTHILLKHDRTLKFPCTSCDKAFCLKSSLKDHEMKMHRTMEEKKCQCHNKNTRDTNKALTVCEDMNVPGSQNIVAESFENLDVVPEPCEICDVVSESYEGQDIVPEASTSQDIRLESFESKNIVPESFGIQDIELKSDEMQEAVQKSCESQDTVSELNTNQINFEEQKEPYQQCTTCSTSYTEKGCRRKRINKNLKNQTPKLKKVTRYNCDVCLAGYGKKSGFKRHMFDKHNLELNDCSKYSSISFVAKKDDKENRILTKVEKYCCSTCSSTYNRRQHFKKHMHEKHDINVTNFSQYLKVVTAAIRQTDLCCTLCNVTFQTVEELNAHKKQHRPFICAECGASFPRRTDLADHQSTHTDTSRYVCPHCGRPFKSRTSFAKHLHIHTKPGQFSCEVCGRRFTHKSALNTHRQLKHEKSIKYPCNICGKVFTLKSSLKIHHKRIHGAVRETKFTCQFCGSAYLEKNTLKRHIEFKHDDSATKPTCKFCDKILSSNTKVLRHIASFHKSELVGKNKKTPTDNDKKAVENEHVSTVNNKPAVAEHVRTRSKNKRRKS